MPVRTAALAVLLAAASVGCEAEVAGPGAVPSPPTADDLVRPGARAVGQVAGDLDGDGIEEIVVSSVSTDTDEFGLATPFLEVFDVRGERWVRVFDATGAAPAGAGAPPEMLVASEDGFVSQSVQTLELVDFATDGRPEVVAGIANAGATAGPLELWILSMGPEGELVTELYRATARGGEILVEGARLRFEFAVYRKRDPGCCPSFRAVQTIGWSLASEGIEVLSQRRFRLKVP